MFLNSPIVRDYATSFAARLAPAAKQSLDKAVTEAYRLALNRKPTATELADNLAFIKQQAASYQANGKANAQALALADLGQVLMSLNEFVYPD